jgi:single-stranded DNA-binding protein
MVEGWFNADGSYRERKNRIAVEVVGKDSAEVAERARLGSWVTLEGYIRSEQFKGQDLTKVRTLKVDVWEVQNE